MIAGLDKRVDIIFSEDASCFYLHLPYCDKAKELLQCFSIHGITSKWLPEIKAREIDTFDYNLAMLLLKRYFSANTKPVEITEEVF